MKNSAENFSKHNGMKKTRTTIHRQMSITKFCIKENVEKFEEQTGLKRGRSSVNNQPLSGRLGQFKWLYSRLLSDGGFDAIQED